MGLINGKQEAKPEFAPGESLTRRVLALLDDGGKGEEEVTASTLASSLALPVSEVEAELKTLVRFGNLVRRTGKNGEVHYSATPRRKLLGDLLVESGHLSAEQLKEALDEQSRTGERLGVILLDRGYVTKQVIGKMLEMQRGIPYVNLSAYPIDELLVRSLPERVIMEHKIVPLARSGDEIHLAMLDPSDIMAVDTVGRFLHGKVRPFLTTESDFAWVVNKYFDVGRKVGESLTDADPSRDSPDAAAATAAVGVVEAFDDSPVVRVLNTIVQDAVRIGATDIHVEPEADETPVRFRIDGLLVDKTVLPRQVAEGVSSRLKVLAGMDIAERIRPQDGRVLFSVEGREYDLRVATLGTAFGERVAIRLLNNRQVQVGLERLGLSVDQQLLLERLLRRQHGMILVTGPTGSGKTTTLYASLSFINERVRNIMTIEDPVEYRLPGITQIPVREKSGITFGIGLRAILRHDPDVIMVGEVRDSETASIAIHAALTGHLVLTTLHTNNATGAMVRLVDMGIEPYLLTSSVLAVVGQRLVRVLCKACKGQRPAGAEDVALLGLQPRTDLMLPMAAGCPECGNLGYRGRTGVFEILTMDDAVREHVLQRKPANAILEAARAAGMMTLREALAEKVLEGVTTVEEFQRLTSAEAA
jgi:type IV pilus assembly protein PilB